MVLGSSRARPGHRPSWGQAGSDGARLAADGARPAAPPGPSRTRQGLGQARQASLWSRKALQTTGWGQLRHLAYTARGVPGGCHCVGGEGTQRTNEVFQASIQPTPTHMEVHTYTDEQTQMNGHGQGPACWERRWRNAGERLPEVAVTEEVGRRSRGSRERERMVLVVCAFPWGCGSSSARCRNGDGPIEKKGRKHGFLNISTRTDACC